MARQIRPGQLQENVLYNISASYAVTASYAMNAGGGGVPSGTVSGSEQITALGFVTSSATASFITNSQTASMSVATASYVTSAQSASYVNPLVQSVIITGSLIVTGSASGGGDIDTSNSVLYDDTHL